MTTVDPKTNSPVPLTGPFPTAPAILVIGQVGAGSAHQRVQASAFAAQGCGGTGGAGANSGYIS